ncbi:MAG: MerR family transcriptional regulator [Alphaproteobacteria bacterium]|mgnify:CR=1 FL=1|nr:MerR family transcriptional regulator [Alphaproteobacteria bacterium]
MVLARTVLAPTVLDCPDADPEAPEGVEISLARVKSLDAFRTIGEAAAELGLKTHVLRFWETKFCDLKPMKRADGRRHYRPEDMQLLRTLKQLLHVQGLTIRGAVKALDDRGAVKILSEQGLAVSVSDTIDHPADIVETGASVRDLQNAVREAVERGDFAVPVSEAGAIARQRLESLLSDLSGLKLRLDQVRSAA